MNTPNLLSVSVASDGLTATFVWEPYFDPSIVTDLWGSVQGFDNNGIHVIGAFVYKEQLEAGNITVPLTEPSPTAVIACELDVNGYTDMAMPPSAYQFAKSNVLDVSFPAVPGATVTLKAKGKGHNK